MALAEKYCSVAGGGAHDGSSAANAWTLAEAFTNATGLDRVNIVYDAGGYSTGADTVDGVATNRDPLVFRGYNSIIGDLDAQGNNADGSLNTTNFPVITCTGVITPATGVIFQNLVFTGALASALISSTTVDAFGFVSCSLTNTNNNAAARCVIGDNNCFAANSDFYCSGAAHNTVWESDNAPILTGCRFRGTDNADILLTSEIGIICTGCTFIGPGVGGSSTGISITSVASIQSLIEHNTFYGLDVAIQLPNTDYNTLFGPILKDNQCTDCGKYIDNAYSATDEYSLLNLHSRTRDVTTMPAASGFFPAVEFGGVTTDTGGAETDYVAAASQNFRLISTSPAINAALIAGDIGAYQRVPDFPDVGNVTEDDTTDGATGTYHEATEAEVQLGVTFGASSALTGTLAAGGGLLTHPGMSGGMRG